MRVLSLSLALLAASPAYAARHEISFDYDHLFPTDAGVETAVGYEGVNSYGLRGGYAPLQNDRLVGLVIQAGWRRGVERRTTTYGPSRASSLETALVSDAFSLGTKVDLEVANIFYPYIGVHAMLLRSSIKLDSQPGDTESTGRYAEQALAPAGAFFGGFELMLPDRRSEWPVTAAVFLEAGYQIAGNTNFETMGTLNQSGAIIRTGIGLRF